MIESDSLDSNLTRILLQSEMCWSELLNSVNDEESRGQVAALAGDIRERLQEAISASNTLFEQNMQCTATILWLKRDLARIQEEKLEQICAVQQGFGFLRTVAELQSKEYRFELAKQ